MKVGRLQIFMTRLMLQIYTIFEKYKKKLYFCKEMLQRIQTIFLIIALLCEVVLYFTSFGVNIFGSIYVVAGFGLVSFVLAILAILSYKKRPRQILLNNINIFINALLIGVLLYWLLNLSGGISFPEKGIELIFPSVAIFCLLMANLYIRRDERLVKSVDRLR